MKIRLFVIIGCLVLVYGSYLMSNQTTTANVEKQSCAVVSHRLVRDQDIIKILDALSADQPSGMENELELCAAELDTQIGLVQVKYQPQVETFSITVGKKVFTDNGLDGTLDTITEDSHESTADFLANLSEYTNAKVEVMKTVGVYQKPIGQSE